MGEGGFSTYMVTLLAWMAARLVSSNRLTRYASLASCKARTADDWKRKSVCKASVRKSESKAG